ncbi:MAG: DUF4340 domain-containing protein, partial [Planctomycetota bacterium]
IKDNPEDPAAYGLTQPTATLTVALAQATTSQDDDSTTESDDSTTQTVTHKLTVGGPQNLEKTHYFATYNDSPAVFTLPKADIDKLLKTADDFRDKKITPASRADVNTVTLERPAEGDLAFRWDNAAWVFEAPDTGYAPEADRVNALIDAFFNTDATSFIDTSTKKLTPPLVAVTLGLAGQDDEKLNLHEHTTGNLLAIRTGESLGYVVPRDAFAEAFNTPLAFRSLTALDVTEDQLASVQLIRSGAFPATYDLQRTEGQPDQWDIEGLGFVAVRQLLSQIAPLRATQWHADAPITTPEGVTLKLTTREGVTHEIHVHTDSATATILGAPNAFNVPPSVVTAVNAELRETRVLNLDAQQIAKVRMGDYVLRRDDAGAYTLTGGEIDETQAATLYNALAGLAAEHFIDMAPTTDPTTTLEITTRDGAEHTLKTWATPRPTAQLGDQVFTLSSSASTDLTTAPVR